ncbi:MAG: 4Fe-4S dicluster domain-containing protein [Bacteroidales bacterium]|nr:4Fe-4S dicluster domain-containing protein [Bacteroidales bacterium]
MNKPKFHHALKISKDICIGCTHCMTVCPTEAIRVRNGKAELTDNRCIDCGECFRVCPVNAIIIEQDDFNKIFEYKYRVALVPAVLIGQFPAEISTRQIYSVLMELGFTHVYEVEHGADILSEASNDYMQDHKETRPLISSFCPAIVRLIQVKFPALVDNIIHLKPPLDIAALYYKQQLVDQGIDEDEIGIFYITPCAAKIAAVKSPVGEKQSPINGVINMDFVYNKVYTGAKKISKDSCILPGTGRPTAESVCWSLTNGEAENIEGRTLAIDGIHNVIEFLEKLENEELKDIDFLELRACDESCAGGVLISGNRFLTTERLKNRAGQLKSEQLKEQETSGGISKYQAYLSDHLNISKVHPRSMMKLDENMTEAMKKMKRVGEIIKCLPDVDCAACGSPTCHALAEDIVQGEADINQCIFIQRMFEEKGILSTDDARGIMKQIWGDDKLKRNC